MKVCTDACLFGALFADHRPPTIDDRRTTTNCLDIGTGTGLLSLIYAQKDHSAIIDAIEIDEATMKQAKENFEASPWKQRLNIFNADILTFETDKKYDLIISNPPFFEGDLLSADEYKNNAKHDSSLSLQQLLEVVSMHLSPDGWFAVLLPYHRVEYFEELATEYDLHSLQKILVRQSPKHGFFRGILFFSRNKTRSQTDEIIIRETDGNYSQAFTTLLKEYYLNL